MIPKGTTFDYTVKGSTTTTWWSGLFTVAEFEGDIRDRLSPMLNVVSLSIEANTWTGGVLAYPYTARVRVSTRVDHAQAGDVKSIVAGVFATVAGSMPSVTQGSSFSPGSGAGEREAPAPFDFGSWLSSLFPDIDLSTAVAVSVLGIGAIVIVLAARD